MLPALSFIALWSLIHCMARDALRRAYRNPADSGLLAQDLLDIGTGNEWHAIYGARLARAFALCQDARALLVVLVGVVVNMPVQRCLSLS
jgi:hypothetical protein